MSKVQIDKRWTILGNTYMRKSKTIFNETNLNIVKSQIGFLQKKQEFWQMQLYSIQVHGRVQGVWFRKATFDKAQQLGVRGYVKNMPDGGVFIHALAEADTLAHFIDWCRVGPPLSRVDGVSLQLLDSRESHTNFDIR